MGVKRSFGERLLISILFPLGIMAAFQLYAEDRDSSPEPVRSFDVQSQDLAAALMVFAEQAGVQVAMKADSVHGLTAHAVVEDYSARQALEVLIDGVGLRANWVTGNTVTIAPQEVSSPVPGQATEGRREAGVHIEEVVVTARRQAERLQSVPVTISAFDSEALRRASIGQTSDLMMKVPGVFRNTTGGPVLYYPTAPGYEVEGYVEGTLAGTTTDSLKAPLPCRYATTWSHCGLPVSTTSAMAIPATCPEPAISITSIPVRCGSRCWLSLLIRCATT